MKTPRVPVCTIDMEKGSSLADILGPEAIRYLASNFAIADPGFPSAAFRRAATRAVEGLGIMGRATALARVMHDFLPPVFDLAAERIIASLAPARLATSGNGMAPFFYLPHGHFIALYGLDPQFNDGNDPFDSAMRALHEITRRFTAEFSIRPFLIAHQKRTIRQLKEWTRDPDPHVRRLCSEGSRPRLPWAQRIPAFVKDPTPALPILEALKDDPELYVRRSVANHVGDIAKDHPELALNLCRRWLRGADEERRWVIRHALRHPAKKRHEEAIEIRRLAGGKR